MSDQGQIIDRIRAHIEAGGIAATPINYDFWYRYVTSSEAGFVDAVSKALEVESPLTRRAVERIRREYLGGSDGEDLVQLAEHAAAQIDTMTAYIERTGGDVRVYNAALRDSHSTLSGKPDLDTQRALLAEMIGATAAMIEKTERLEEQLVASSSEIAELRESLEEARSESRTDPLTGLNNRKAFAQYLDAQAARALADRKPLCLAFCDIDNFKSFNDTWGHRMGDEVLRLVAQCVDKLCQGLGYPARFGGEEFVIVLPGKALEAANDIAEQFRDFIGSRTLRSKQSNQEVGRITLSWGVSELRWTDTIETLMERADAALYLAKQQGRNRVCTERDLDDASVSPRVAVSA